MSVRIARENRIKAIQALREVESLANGLRAYIERQPHNGVDGSIEVYEVEVQNTIGAIAGVGVQAAEALGVEV